MQAAEKRFLPRIADRIIYCFLFLLLAFEAIQSIRLARADLASKRNTPASVREAVGLDSGNATFHEQLAEHIEERGENPDPELKAAVALNPRDPGLMIRLALRQEVEGHYQDAERTLLRSLEIDKRFDTPWALANYYFRRGNEPEFWRWIREALARSYGDRTAIFRLCWAMSEDKEVILNAIPPRHDLLGAYLQFLDETHRQNAADLVAVQVAREARSSDLPTLLDYIDYAIGSGSTNAVPVWNYLCRRKLLPYAELDAQHGNVITNGDFAVNPSGRGFDWRTEQVEGISVGPAEGAAGISIAMNGKEPEDVTILWQIIPVSPGTEYELTTGIRATGPGTTSGMTWNLSAAAPNAEILAQSGEFPPGTELKAPDLRFNAGTNHTARISLHYHRAAGTVRWEGTVAIRKVAIEAVR
jgi:tetratricopeptide (TPR) repeat protein